MSLLDEKSKKAFSEAFEVIPGGVDSPVRAAAAVGRSPLFIARGKGAHLWDVDDNSFIDYVGSWGPLILGHADPAVLAAIASAAEKGLSFGAPTLAETSLVQELLEAFPSMDMARLVTSGTEATMSALRVARGVTGRELIVKFEGCYHGHTDSLLVKAGSGALTHGTPTSAGVPPQIAATTLVAHYNDSEGIQKLFEESGKKIAAVIVEPVAGNMGVVAPKPDFLPLLRKLCTTYGSLLILDEVMTGFRVAHGGAQELYGVDPDMTCLGKIIGGGLPLAAYGGKAEYMAYVAPLGPVYQAGTLAGNPLAVAAGLATLKALKQDDFYPSLQSKTSSLVKGIRSAAARHALDVQVNSVGAMFSLFFTAQKVEDFASACTSDTKLFARFYNELLDAGVYIPPSQFESWFMSAAHTEEDSATTLAAIDTVFAAL